MFERFRTGLATYTLRPDGKTERFGQIPQEQGKPQDAIVFVPPWSVIKDAIPANLKLLFEYNNEEEYQRMLIGYVQRTDNPRARIHIHNHDRIVLTSNREIQEQIEQVWLVLMKDNDTLDLTLPVSKEPRIGWYPLDMTIVQLQDGVWETKWHLGSPITEIYPSSTSNS